MNPLSPLPQSHSSRIATPRLQDFFLTDRHWLQEHAWHTGNSYNLCIRYQDLSFLASYTALMAFAFALQSAGSVLLCGLWQGSLPDKHHSDPLSNLPHVPGHPARSEERRVGKVETCVGR